MKQEQPFDITHNRDALLTVETVAALTGESIRGIWRKLAAGKFPPPVVRGHRHTRWRCGDVLDWLAAFAR